MGKMCRKYITISGILLIYAICLPSAFISNAQINVVQNNFTNPIRTNRQWNLEHVFNRTVFRELENTLDNRLYKKDKIRKIYGLIQNYINNKTMNTRLMCDKEYTHVHEPISIDNNNKYIFEDTNNQLIEEALAFYNTDNNTLEEYFRENYRLNKNGKYIEYKVILNKMNIRHTSTI